MFSKITQENVKYTDDEKYVRLLPKREKVLSVMLAVKFTSPNRLRRRLGKRAKFVHSRVHDVKKQTNIIRTPVSNQNGMYRHFFVV